MKRKILLAFLVLIIPSLCFAVVNASFVPKDAAGVVDLASNLFPAHSNSTVHWNYRSGNSYSDVYQESQIIGSLEFRNDNETSGGIQNVQINVELISGDSNDGWFFTYTKDGITYKRPFSILIHGRQEKSSSWYGSYTQNLQNNSNLLVGDCNSSKTYTAYSLSHSSSLTIKSSDPAYMWDFILVFDKNADRATNSVESANGNNTYDLVSSGTEYYEALLRISVTYSSRNSNYGNYTTGRTFSYVVLLRGTYNPTNPHSNTTSNITSTLNVSRLASAESLNIASLIENGTATKTNVGTYNFKAINTGGNDSTRSFSLFLSSSSVGTTAGSEFMFKQVDSSGRVSSFATNHNAIKFYAYMTSQKTNATAEFHGQDVYTSSLSGSSITISGVHDTTYNYTKWEDYGDISIAIPSGQTINGAAVTAETLISGRYVGNIYIHVVSNP